MTPASWLLAEDYAGLRAQGLGLAEAAGLAPEPRTLIRPPGWRWLSPRLWPDPLARFGAAVAAPWPEVAIGCGGTAAVALAALGRHGLRSVQVQHPRMDPRWFDLVVVNTHDRLSGPNVIVVRTALHRVTPARLAAAAVEWRERLDGLPRPLVAVLVGGSNGRFRLGAAEGMALGAALAGMMEVDRVGVALTPSRRTAPEVTAALRAAVEPRGGFVWDERGENPYFGMLALADAIVVTEDSVSMISEAVATAAPVLVAELPGGSRRIGAFSAGLLASGRVRRFAGRLEVWPVAPLDDTAAAGAELRRRLGIG